MQTLSPILRTSGLRKRFEPEGSWVLDGISLDVCAGERVAIIGPSGSGKSTLLGVLGTLEAPDAGTVSINGADTGELSNDARACLRRDAIGFIFQDHHLLPQCTALQNVMLPLLAQPKRSITSEHRDHATALLSQLGLEDRLNAWPHQLSTGQRQRIAVARALVGAPSVVLADEPTGSLDRASAEALMALLLEHVGNSALVVVTHSERVASVCDRVMELTNGQLEARAQPQ